MRTIPPMMCTKAGNQYQDPYQIALNEYIENRKAIVNGIRNILIANKCSYAEAEKILESVKNILKVDCTLCLREGVKK